MYNFHNPTNQEKMKNSEELIYAFIDSQNLNLSVRNDIFDERGNKRYEGWRLDFGKFYMYLRDKYRVDKAFLFIGKVSGNERLYQTLKDYGYHLVFKPTLVINQVGESIIKGNVDAELVLHAMIQYPNYSKAIIVSGDGDYHCLIEYLEQQNKLYRVLIPNRYSYSRLLKGFIRYFNYVSDLRGKLEFKNKKRD